MNRYRLDADAASDLRLIHKHIACDNPAAADRFITGLKQRLRLLGSQPFLGESREDLAASLRSFSVGNDVIFYRPITGGIEVARVLHAARDVNSQF
jgi:toxin ParE1/3/4